MDLQPLFKLMAEKHASDLFFSAGAPVYIKIEGELRAVNRQPMDANLVKHAAYSLMSEVQIRQFETDLEINFGFSVEGLGRYRVNTFRQRGSVAMVIRYINSAVPSFDELGLPPVLKNLSLESPYRWPLLMIAVTKASILHKLRLMFFLPMA